MKSINPAAVVFVPTPPAATPAMLDTTRAQQLVKLTEHVVSVGNTYNTAIASLARMSFVIPAEATAGANVVLPLWVSGQRSQLELEAVWFLPGAALVASDTDFSAIALSTDDGSTGQAKVIRRQLAAATTRTQANGGTGSWTAEQPVRLAMPSGGRNYVSKNAVLTWRSTKTGAGVAVPLGSLLLVWRI